MDTGINDHLSDEEAVRYVNSKKDLPESVIGKIEQHLYIVNCDICRKKISELAEINRALVTKLEDSQADDEADMCDMMGKVIDFMQKKLNIAEREKFIEHMAECEKCRKATALYASTLPSSDKAISDEKFSRWNPLRDGLIRLSNSIGFHSRGAEAFFMPAIGASGIKFRDRQENSSYGKKSIEIKLPENGGGIVLTYYEQTGRNKIVIEPTGSEHQDLLIEVYDGSGILLKSAEGAKQVSCLVKDGDYTVRVNSKFEVPINFG